MRNNKPFAIIIIVSVLLSLGATVFAALYFNNAFTLLWALIGVLFSSIFASIFHECFHLFFGAANGMALLSVNFLGLELSRREGGLKISYKSEGAYGGYCEMIPKNGGDKIVKRFASMTLGGLVGSFLYLLILTALAFLPFLLSYKIYAFFVSGIGVAFYAAVLNACPFESPFGKSDAMYISELNTTGEDNLTVALLTLEGELYLGKRPMELSKNLLFADYTDVGIAESNVLFNYKYWYYLDKGDIGGLVKHKETYRTLDVIPVYESQLKADCFFVDVLSRTARLDEEMTKILSDGSLSSERILAYYYAYIENDKEKVAEHLRNAEKKLYGYAVSGIAKAERALLEKLRKNPDV